MIIDYLFFMTKIATTTTATTPADAIATRIGSSGGAGDGVVVGDGVVEVVPVGGVTGTTLRGVPM